MENTKGFDLMAGLGSYEEQEERGVAFGLGLSFTNANIDSSNYSGKFNDDIGRNSSSFADIPIASSNIGFQLLKKHGWKEGTGLGVSEQGRLEPVEAHVKKNKRGLGADKVKKGKEHSKNPEKHSNESSQKTSTGKKTKTKGISKKVRKMLEFEKRMQEKEFERAFFREFWPDNV